MRPSRTQLDIDGFPRGTVQEIWLEVYYDGLGQPVHIPVVIARGSRDGPVAGITAAVHGNEVNGTRAIHRFLSSIDPSRLRGDVVAVPVVNVSAYLLRQRRTDDGQDLNHLFPGRCDGREAEVLAHRVFTRVVEKVDFLIDLHTASFGRINSLYVRADLESESTARMAYLQRPQIIVHNAPSDGTLRGAAAAVGIPAITVEIGNPARVQRELVQRAVVGLRAVLSARGMLPRRQRARLGEPILCCRSEWVRTDHGGLLEVLPGLATMVEKGEVIARMYDAFGHVAREYVAPFTGVVIGRSVDPVADTGARILHLGEVVPRSAFPLSAVESSGVGEES